MTHRNIVGPEMILHAICTAILLLSCAFAQGQSFQTTVAPLPHENFAGPCDYDMTLPGSRHQVGAVWVTYDRGRDIMKFYSDPDIIAFAHRQNLALILAHQCPAKSAPGGPEEMDMDPSHGVGRALFAAIDQFGQQSKHPELATAKLILLGFSGTGALFAHFVSFAPERVLASILAAPAHYDPVGVDNVQLSDAGIAVPEFIVVGGSDKVAGTQRPYDYFRRYRDQGAPWLFVVQNETSHCCIINSKSLILNWLHEIIKLREPSQHKPLRRVDTSRGWEAYIRTCVSLVKDSWHQPTWGACDAAIKPTGSVAPKGMIRSGWLPSRKLAREWLAFVRQPTHPTTSMP